MPSPFDDLHETLLEKRVPRDTVQRLKNMVEVTAFEDDRARLRDVIEQADAHREPHEIGTTVAMYLPHLLEIWRIIQGKYMELYVVYMVLLNMVASGGCRKACRGLVFVGNGHIGRIHDILRDACDCHCVEMLKRNRDNSWAVASPEDFQEDDDSIVALNE